MGESVALEQETDNELNEQPEDSFSKSQMELDRTIEELNGIDDSPAPAMAGNPLPVDSGSHASASDLVWDIPVEINIVMGTARLTVARLMELESGEVVELDRRIGEPLDIAVNGRNIAKGEIVMMDDDPSKFAIQVTELVGR